MSSVTAQIEAVVNLKNNLLNEAKTEDEHLDTDKCLDLLRALKEELVLGKSSAFSKMRLVPVLEGSGAGKALTKSLKSFRRHKRSHTSASDSNKENLILLVDKCNQLLEELKVKVDEESKGQKQSSNSSKVNVSGKKVSSRSEPSFPSSVQEYKMRLVQQKKEIYKDPPVLPERATVDAVKQKYPKRKEDGTLAFEAKFKDFRPNLTPEEVLRAGAFGGTYFRPITSSVTNLSYRSDQVLKDTIPDEWYAGLDKRLMLTSSAYHEAINKYGVKCGGSLGMWESSGWISEVDPYGWFQWYCRFYQGRRCSDDERQVKRWMKSAGEVCVSMICWYTLYDILIFIPFTFLLLERKV